MSKEIGTKLKQLRKSRKLTQEDVANRVKITRSTISNYEIGRRTPHLKDLQKLATVFGVGLDYFGITPKDEAIDLLERAKEVFKSPDVDSAIKDALHLEFMKLYLEKNNIYIDEQS